MLSTSCLHAQVDEIVCWFCVDARIILLQLSSLETQVHVWYWSPRKSNRSDEQNLLTKVQCQELHRQFTVPQIREIDIMVHAQKATGATR